MYFMKEPIFIVDTMLGKVARWLRMLGYDTLYYKRIDDWRILKIAEREGRIIITRDRSLCNRALKRKLKCILIEHDTIEERLAFIAYKVGIRLFIDLDRSRCPVCNGELVRVSKDKVIDKVPKRVLEKHEDFWVCRRCGKVYWLGMHWRGIEETLRKSRTILSKWRERGLHI